MKSDFPACSIKWLDRRKIGFLACFYYLVGEGRARFWMSWVHGSRMPTAAVVSLWHATATGNVKKSLETQLISTHVLRYALKLRVGMHDFPVLARTHDAPTGEQSLPSSM